VLFTSFKHPPPAAPASTDVVSGVWGKVKWNVRVKGVAAPTTLAEDIESLLSSYRVASAVVLFLVVVSGGAPALMGAGISLYCEGTPEGTARYESLKQKWRDFNK
jgi:hypothetical protein